MEDLKAYVTGFLIWSVIGMVVMGVVGGNFRTQVTYSPSLYERVTGEVPFEESITARHWLGGLIKGRQPDLQNAMAKYMHEGERVTELTIITRHSLTDWLVTGLTLGIYCPITVDVSGKVGRVGQAHAVEFPQPGRRAAQLLAELVR